MCVCVCVCVCVIGTGLIRVMLQCVPLETGGMVGDGGEALYWPKGDNKFMEPLAALLLALLRLAAYAVGIVMGSVEVDVDRPGMGKAAAPGRSAGAGMVMAVGDEALVRSRS